MIENLYLKIDVPIYNFTKPKGTLIFHNFVLLFASYIQFLQKSNIEPPITLHRKYAIRIL